MCTLLQRQHKYCEYVRRGFLRRLPRPVRWLWFTILAVVAAECAGIALGLVFGGDVFSTALQMSSILAGPLALGLLVVVVAGLRSSREPRAANYGQPDAEPQGRQSPNPQEPLEVAVGRAAGRAVTALARSREGKAAIRQTARLVRAFRAAAQPPPESTRADEFERPSEGPPGGR